ncbi:Solute carrier 26 [Podochytrium sp. JEL0797]|nr:Solute carrier 26 [Podochytrium sp. JEL0797]
MNFLNLNALDMRTKSTALATGIPTSGLAQNEPPHKTPIVHLRQMFPLIDQMKTYTKHLFFDDLLTALTIAFVLLPQAIAYASLAEISPMQSLISAMWPPLLYIIFGASRQLSIGPEAMVSVITGATIAGILGQADNVYAASELAITLAFLVGIGCLILFILQAGFIDNILSGRFKSDLRGTASGIAWVACGTSWRSEFIAGKDIQNSESCPQASAVRKLKLAIDAFGTANHVSVTIGVINVAFLLGFRQFKKRYGRKSIILKKTPETFLMLVTMIAISYGLDLNGNHGVGILGNFDHKIPGAALPTLNSDIVSKLLEPAIIILVVGFIESQTVTKKFGLRNGYFPNGSQELLSFGLINVIVSFLGGFPVFGSLPRSRILANSGGKTTLANAMAALIVILVSQVLVPVLQYLPKTTLASIVFVAALGLIEVHEISFIFRLRAWNEIFMFLVTWILTIVFEISTAIIFCLGFSALLIIRRTTETSMTVIGRVREFEVLPQLPSDEFHPLHMFGPVARMNTIIDDSATYAYEDIASHPRAELLEGVVVLRILAPLMFYNVGQMGKAVGQLIRAEMEVLQERRNKRRARKLAAAAEEAAQAVEEAAEAAAVLEASEAVAVKEASEAVAVKESSAAAAENVDATAVVSSSPTSEDPAVRTVPRVGFVEKPESLFVAESEATLPVSGFLRADDIPGMDMTAAGAVPRNSFSAKSVVFSFANGSAFHQFKKNQWWRKKESGEDIVPDTPLHTLVLDFKGCLEMDSHAVLFLDKIFHSFQERDVRVVVCSLTAYQIKEFKRAGFYEKMEVNIFPDIESAMDDVQSRVALLDWRKEEF